MSFRNRRKDSKRGRPLFIPYGLFPPYYIIFWGFVYMREEKKRGGRAKFF